MSRTALILSGGWEGHDPKGTSAWFAELLLESGLQPEIREDLSVLDRADFLRGLALLVPNWTMGTLTGDQEKNLLAAVEAGTGLGGSHGGMGDAFRGQTQYQFAVGGQFVAHPDDRKSYRVEFATPAHELVRGLEDFEITTEQYYMHTDPANTLLATTVFQTRTAPWINGTRMPVSWIRQHGKGRVFYSSIGHSLEELRHPTVRELMRRGMRWAARLD